MQSQGPPSQARPGRDAGGGLRPGPHCWPGPTTVLETLTALLQARPLHPAHFWWAGGVELHNCAEATAKPCDPRWGREVCPQVLLSPKALPSSPGVRGSDGDAQELR